jgi:hypothetical protein
MDCVMVSGNKPSQCIESGEGNVTVENQHPTVTANVRERLKHRMPSAELRLLQCKSEVCGSEVLSYLLAAVTIYHADVPSSEGTGRVYYVLDKTPAAEPVQNLRQRGVHPCALAGRKYDHIEGRGHDGESRWIRRGGAISCILGAAHRKRSD